VEGEAVRVNLDALRTLADSCEQNAREWRRRGFYGRAEDQEQFALRLREFIAAAETH
jgi:hypothetical protein